MRSICPCTAFAPSNRHDHRVVLNEFSVSFRSSPCTSVSLNKAYRLGLASRKLYRAWIVPRAFRNGSIYCHSILKGEDEHMSVTMDVDIEWGALFHYILVESPLCTPFILDAPLNALPTMFLRSRLSSVIADFTSSYSTSPSVDFVE